MRNSYKIMLYDQTGLYIDDIKTREIENFDSIKVSSNIGGGQGEVDLIVKTNYDNLKYNDRQLVEIAIYNDDYKSGRIFYAGFIKNINRTYSQEEGDNVELEILGLGSLLGEYETNFSYTGQLGTGIYNLLLSFYTQYNISNNMEFVGNTLFKNWIIDTTNITISKEGTYFDILTEMCELANKTFSIRANGTILLGDQSGDEKIFTINNDIISLKISSTRQTEILLDGNNYFMNPGDKIFLQNINQNFNLDGQRIEKIEFGLLNTTIYLGEIWDLAGEIIK